MKKIVFVVFLVAMLATTTGCSAQDGANDQNAGADEFCVSISVVQKSLWPHQIYGSDTIYYFDSSESPEGFEPFGDEPWLVPGQLVIIGVNMDEGVILRRWAYTSSERGPLAGYQGILLDVKDAFRQICFKW